MFRIADGRECFYQWDSNRKIIVEDAAITELHFCNKTDDCSLVVEVKNGLANVPNILLQSDWDIRVYAFCSDYTKVEKRFKVVARTKPSDYAYTETEVRTYNQLADTISNLSAGVSYARTAAEAAITKANEAGNTAYTLNENLKRVVLPKIDNLETTANTANYTANAALNDAQILNTRVDELSANVGNIEAVLNEITNLQASYIGGAEE